MDRPTVHVLASLAFVLLASTAASAQSPATPGSKEISKMDATVGALKKIDVKQGTGAEAVAGKPVVVHYTGWLYDPASPESKGRKFDSSVDRREPFVFPLGGGRVIRHRDLVIDLERRRVQRGARRISLTPTEFEILRHLASRPGRVYTRSELLELLRDYEALDQDERTINVHVSHLREKIEDDPATPAFVLTVRGVGYAFAER